jgi:hypothetical protein
VDTTRIVLVIAGLAALAGTWAVWTGRFRAAGKDLLHPNWAWTAVPAFAVVLLAYGLEPLLGDAASWIALPIAILGFVMLLWQPTWFGPRWWRERDPADLGAEWGPNAALLAAGKPGMGDAGSLAEAQRLMGPGEPAVKLRAGLVTERHGRPSAAQRAGVVEGWLLLYDRGLVFAASSLEDKMREQTVIERIAAADVRSVVEVPRGTEGDGRRHVRDAKTPFMRRIRLDAQGATWLLETRRPGRLIGELERRYAARTEGTAAPAR